MSVLEMRRARGLVAALVVVAWGSSASLASLSTPNGNPTGPAVALSATNGGRSFLDPNPAQYMVAGSCPWLTPALDAQGYSEANGWTINRIALQGSITLATYRAWADTDPAVSKGGMSLAAENSPGQGGATIALTYTASTAQGTTDPSGASVRWLQVIRTNSPSGYGTANGNTTSVAGSTIYLDNGWNQPTDPPNQRPDNPFYGSDDVDSSTGYAANATGFLDRPRRDLLIGIDWEAQVFVSTWDKANKIINIYDGVWWGFETLPSPGTGTMLALAGIVAVRRRRA